MSDEEADVLGFTVGLFIVVTITLVVALGLVLR